MKPRKWWFIIIPIIGLAGISYLGDRRAKARARQVRAFCENVEIGGVPDAVILKARSAALGADEMPRVEGKPGEIFVRDSVGSTRRACVVKHTMNRIVSAELLNVDE